MKGCDGDNESWCGGGGGRGDSRGRGDGGDGDVHARQHLHRARQSTFCLTGRRQSACQPRRRGGVWMQMQLRARPAPPTNALAQSCTRGHRTCLHLLLQLPASLARALLPTAGAAWPPTQRSGWRRRRRRCRRCDAGWRAQSGAEGGGGGSLGFLRTGTLAPILHTEGSLQASLPAIAWACSTPPHVSPVLPPSTPPPCAGGHPHRLPPHPAHPSFGGLEQREHAGLQGRAQRVLAGGQRGVRRAEVSRAAHAGAAALTNSPQPEAVAPRWTQRGLCHACHGGPPTRCFSAAFLHLPVAAGRRGGGRAGLPAPSCRCLQPSLPSLSPSHVSPPSFIKQGCGRAGHLFRSRSRQLLLRRAGRRASGLRQEDGRGQLRAAPVRAWAREGRGGR